MPALAASDVMQIFVKTIEGVTITLQVQDSMTVEQVMTMIQGKSENIRVKSRLSYGSVNMLDHSQLSDYQVEPNSTLFENGRVRGGGDQEMPDAFDIKQISDEVLVAEVINRGLMPKVLAQWTPTLPPIPDIANKNEFWLNLECFSIFLKLSGTFGITVFEKRFFKSS